MANEPVENAPAKDVPSVTAEEIVANVLKEKGERPYLIVSTRKDKFPKELDAAVKQAKHFDEPVAFTARDNAEVFLYVTDGQGNDPKTGRAVSKAEPAGKISGEELKRLPEVAKSNLGSLSAMSSLGIMGSNNPQAQLDNEFIGTHVGAFRSGGLEEGTREREKFVEIMRLNPQQHEKYEAIELFSRTPLNLNNGGPTR